MNTTLKTCLILGTFLVFLYVLNTVAKKKLNIRYSIIWIIWSLVVLFIAIFPKTIFYLTGLLGIEVASNTVFLIMIAILYLMSFSIFLVISKHSSEITKLNYEIAVLNKELNELKKEKNE